MSAASPKTMSSTKADKGYLYINGTKVNAEWDLKLERDYVDATVFGDPNKTFLTALTNVDLTFEEPKIDFDAQAAREMYDDDPVALAIIDRLAAMERETVFLREEKQELQQKNDNLSAELIKRIPGSPRSKAVDPVKKRDKPKKSRKTGR